MNRKRFRYSYPATEASMNRPIKRDDEISTRPILSKPRTHSKARVLIIGFHPAESFGCANRDTRHRGPILISFLSIERSEFRGTISRPASTWWIFQYGAYLDLYFSIVRFFFKLKRSFRAKKKKKIMKEKIHRSM